MVRAKVEVPFTDLECNLIRSVNSTFECSDERYGQLLAKGFVSLVGETVNRAPSPDLEQADDEPAAEDAAAEEPKPDKMWTASEISAWADAHGIDLSGARKSKAAMLERIAESQ